MKNEGVLRTRSYNLSLLIVRICNLLTDSHHYVLADQLLRSGTSIGANIREAQYAQSKADFLSKLYISLKEANEAEYWLELIIDSELCITQICKDAHSQCSQVKYMLISAINKIKNNTEE